MIYHLLTGKAAPGKTEEAKEALVEMVARARVLGRDVRVLQGLDEACDTFAILQEHGSLEHYKQMERIIREDPEHQEIRAKGKSLFVEGSVKVMVFEQVG